MLRGFLALGLATLAACGTTPFGEVQSIEAEKQLGEERIPTFLVSHGGLYNNAATERYLQELTDKLVANAQVPDAYKPIKIGIIDTNTPSAYTLPGGSIYISRGLIAMSNDESQVAGVIAHEIGHVISRHIAEGIAANQQIIRDIVAQKQTSLQRAGTLNRQVSIVRKELQGRLSEVTTFSKDAELEADNMAIQILKASGYSTSGFGGLLRRLKRWQDLQDERVGVGSIELAEREKKSGYPKVAERVAALGPLSDGANSETQKRLMDLIDGMRFDDQYNGGYIRNGEYWHRTHRLAFDVPSSVFPDHGPFLRLIATSGVIGVRVDRTGDASLEDFVKGFSTSSKIKLGEFRKKSINGLPVTISKGKKEDGDEELLVTVTAIDLDGKIASFILLTKVADESKITPIYNQIVGSVRRTQFGDDPGVRKYKARRVQSTDTVASIAASADFDADSEREVRLLNDLDAGEPLQKDGWVKWVQ